MKRKIRCGFLILAITAACSVISVSYPYLHEEPQSMIACLESMVASTIPACGVISMRTMYTFHIEFGIRTTNRLP